MPETAGIDIFKSSMAWLVALMFPVLILLINSSVSRSILFTFYPIALAMLVRTGPFWVDKVHIIIASFLVGGVYVIINSVSPKWRDSIKDPNSDKLRSGLVFTGMALLTVFNLAVSGFFSQLYLPSNFSA